MDWVRVDGYSGERESWCGKQGSAKGKEGACSSNWDSLHFLHGAKVYKSNVWEKIKQYKKDLIC